MGKGDAKILHPLKRARLTRGLTVRQAGALVVIDGKKTDGGTWHSWETGKKIPKPAAMFELERIFGVTPNDIIPRPDAGGSLPEEPAQLQLV